ncbi:MAG: hypothetical protein GKS07_10900 [Nitrosopumilus sp.]|nr:MAG: hypothetical protein GKS07_10900 [Nitrosopumilus sp.]
MPEQYMSHERLVSQPYFEVKISDKEIPLGESFRLNIATKNSGDYGDIHILSTAFPDLIEIDSIVRISTYDFTQPPNNIVPGEKIIAKYSGDLEHINAKYPSIESMSRPVHSGSTYNLSQIITPESAGDFSIYVKTVNIPHTSSLSHYPQTGVLDHQEEYVEVYSVRVNP